MFLHEPPRAEKGFNKIEKLVHKLVLLEKLFAFVLKSCLFAFAVVLLLIMLNQTVFVILLFADLIFFLLYFY